MLGELRRGREPGVAVVAGKVLVGVVVDHVPDDVGCIRSGVVAEEAAERAVRSGGREVSAAHMLAEGALRGESLVAVGAKGLHGG